MYETLAEIDFAFITVCLFFFFFAGLIIYLRREDRREGYPLEEDDTGRLQNPGSFIFFPSPKTFALAHGHGTVSAPNGKRDTRELALKRTAPSPGSPSEPTGNPLVDGVGPGAWAERSNVVDVCHDGSPKIVPMRAAPGFSIAPGDKDPRGMKVVGCDGAQAGTVSDIWVDKPEAMIRYLEVDSGGRKILLPMTMALINATRGVVSVDAITGAQFAQVPGTANPDQVTLYEEERIVAYYGGGFLYATPDRAEPLL